MNDNSETPDDLSQIRPSKDDPEIGAGNDEIIEDENQISGIDPLAALRQDMFEEEQRPEPYSKPDLLQRMTGTLSSRKVPTRPRPSTPSEPNFGIRTNRNLPPPEPPFRATQTQNDEIHDEFLEERLGTGPLNAPKNKSEPGPGIDGPIQIDGDPKAVGGLFTQPSPGSEYKPPAFTETRGKRRMDPLWDNVDEEVEEIQESSSGILANSLSRPVEERKMLGTGAERQYQVNKFLSYNPKRNLGDRFKELSSVEKILLFVLITAVIGVTGLIAYLYLSSRQIIPTQIFPLVSATQPVAPTTVSNVPIPTSLRLTGGWSFQLNQGALVDGKWLPTSSEWLKDTEIRRVIALPWNKQLEAVINSLQPTDVIDLFMNNGDIFTYKVHTVSQVPLSDSSVMYDTRPSLAIILINPNSLLRQVVVAYP